VHRGLFLHHGKNFGTAAVVAVVALGAALAAAFASGGHTQPATPTSTTAPAPSPTTTTPMSSTPPAVAADRCPLTDLPAPHGVPRRPALAIKIGNEPYGARPQSGLNEADIVFDTPAEGFIMRYIAVYQCNNAASVGPTRSVRWVDWHLVREFHHAILAFAGGINPNVDRVDSFSWLSAADLLENAAGAGVRISSRVPPDNLYTSTAALYRMFPQRKTPPKPVFSFSSKVPAGARRISGFWIDFSYGTDVIWKWDPGLHLWLHTYSGVPDIDALTGKPVTTRNIVILVVDYRFGPYIESTGGSGDVESQTLGGGVGYVLRNGRAIKIFWHRKYLVDPFSFFHGKHELVRLSPGRTWVELVPVRTPMGVVR
jgi:Protein of unknown function (DUF3048) N-terminal domain/Protein of unknown function (DUF3048) C-terminal domain